MPTIIDGSGSATFATPLPLAQGGTGNTTGNVVSSQVAGALNATGSAPLYACRAWVNFNGTGVVAIRASGNVSSITDNGVGAFTVNLTTAMPDVNCAPVCSGQRYAASVSRAGSMFPNMESTTTVRLFTGYEDSFTGAIATDLEFNQIAIFR